MLMLVVGILANLAVLAYFVSPNIDISLLAANKLRSTDRGCAYDTDMRISHFLKNKDTNTLWTR